MQKEIGNILKSKRVGIAGAGGLGSNCAVALARVGIGELVIVDFDLVSMSNLNRQYFFRDQIGEKKVFALRENIKKIDPTVNVIVHDLKLESSNIVEIFSDCDVIVEAFDQATMKQMIIETVQTRLPDIPLVLGLGLAGWGDNSSLKTRRIENMYICGDEKTEASEILPPLAPRVGIVANMQANQVMEILLGKMP